jgi:hypothetical protein
LAEYRTRTIAGIALAVVIASGVGLAVAFYAPSLPSSTTHSTVCCPPFGAISTYITATTSLSTTSYSTSNTALYYLVFRETPVSTCNPSYLSEWSVTLNNETKAQPSNATLPIPDNQWNAGTQYANLSEIIFSVAAGTYNYTIHPNSALTPNSGTVEVNDSSLTLSIELPYFPCTTNATTTISSTSSTSDTWCTTMGNSSTILCRTTSTV